MCLDQLQSHQPNCSSLVVGIGASAGGVEALGRFFDAMPPDSGAAFVVVLHLDPTRESQMAHVLSNRTVMPVVQVADDMQILPNTVYVIAPDKDLTVRKATLHLTEPAESRGHRHPVDVLFRSLAAEHGERAIAIVLSGTGNNGTDGLKEVSAAGGLILVQDPPTAKFDGMPRSAISAGMADHIVAPEAMPEILVRYIGQEYIADPQHGETATSGAQPVIDQILTSLFTRTGNDFRNYRRSTIQRRIQRRLSLKNMDTLEAYKQDLRTNADEAPLLVKDLLINVTSFFRDAEAWKTLATAVVAPLVGARETGASIRAWVPGCSTGEEAYTLAMLISEQAASVGKKFDVKIFATDARDDNLKTARDGFYPLAAVSGLSPERQRLFFDRQDALYQVKKEIRSMVVFAPQNLLRDPPISHLDIVSCRNLLIYLEPEAQQSIIALFHFSLEEGGSLLLGNTETLGRHDGMFETISKKWRIFRRAGPTRLDIVNFPVLRGSTPSASTVERAAAHCSTILRQPQC
jgi:two-component system, chemotaxis family, CheB/CheR fusion protein